VEQISVEVVSGHTDVLNEIDKSFGWSKSPASMELEPISVGNGKRF
jgi:hypothetical protein